jgi:signal transduction histidine kinase
VGLVVHSLSNYITVIDATIELLQLTVRNHEDPHVPIWLAGIAHTTDLMQHSVSRLVSLSAPREFPLKFDHVNLPVLLQRACDYYRRRAGAHLRITFDSIGRIPLVWADRVALAVVADNLLSNAVNASRPEGTIRIEVRAEPGHVISKVTDSGPGLTLEQQQLILQMPPPGAQFGDQPHTGYGLAIANEYIQRLDGELWCENEPGQGTSLLFRLPAMGLITENGVEPARDE